jgi:hypothetical protein
MIQRDDHHIAAAREVLPVVGSKFLTRARRVSAAVQPNHHGASSVIANRGRPDIDAQAIFALHAIVPGEHEGLFVVRPSAPGTLRRHVSVLTGAADAIPGFWLEGRHETIGPGGVVGVRNALEGKDPVSNIAGHAARASGSDCLTVTSHQRCRVWLRRSVCAGRNGGNRARPECAARQRRCALQ